MLDFSKLQNDCMDPIKTYMQNISRTQPIVGYLGALPVATIDVASKVLASQAAAIQLIALATINLVKTALASNRSETLKNAYNQISSGILLNLLTLVLTLLSPIAIIDETCKIASNPADTNSYKTDFSF